MADALEQAQNTDSVAAGDAAPRTWQFSKTKMCKFELIGMCTKGEQCPFAHDKDELRPLPDLTCTKLCTTLIKTGVCSRKSCTYAHTKDELRATSTFHKTKLCRFSQTGHCALGGKCNFAHSPSEIRQVETTLDGAQDDQPFDEGPAAHPPFQQARLPMPAMPSMLSMAAEVLPRQQGGRRAQMRAAGNRRSVHVGQAEGAGAAARGQDAGGYALNAATGHRTSSKTSPAYVTQMTSDFVVTNSFNTFLERGHVDGRMPPRRSSTGWAGTSSGKGSEQERQYAVGFAPRAAGAITGGELAPAAGRAGPTAGTTAAGAAVDSCRFDVAGAAGGAGSWQFAVEDNEGANTYSGTSGASSYALPPEAGFLPIGASPGPSFLPNSTNPEATAADFGLGAAAGGDPPALAGFGHSSASVGGPPALAGSFVVDQADDGWHVKNTFLNFSSPPKPIRSVRTAEGALCTLGGDEEE